MSAAKTHALKTLPDDVEALKIIIAEKDNIITLKEQRISTLEEFVRLHKLKKFAASSEKSIDQHEMFNEAELSVVAEEVLSEQEAERKAQSNTAADKPKKKAGRKPLPDSLPRIRDFIQHFETFARTR